MNVYRWITDPTSKLYDPLLHRLVHKLMKKSFLKLLHLFKQYGCDIVHADFNKVWLHTRKQDFEEAQNHINFVIKQILQNPMFACLSLTPEEYWRILLFKDAYNLGGIKESNNQSCCTFWNISLHLPEALQREFKRHVGEYILLVYKYRQKMLIKQAQDTQITDEDLVEAMQLDGSPEKPKKLGAG